ncbi:hypothetical protein SLH46_12150 [Draconibacterium sp. IB214405]|uniref:hypothetical protein n=1 Tax=Draconibacterium sp. IB214405 TaxID=3097352 RepID=UPI002A14DAC4|nr:hypothetical protein [Draconibacterium sp. IB214405]MDX8339942.1 hypothetical protein [Draconibacterium sp. IB214405]
MSFSTTYKPLVTVNIFHKYYLNKGTNDYFSMDDAEKEKQLAGYQLSDLFSIVPSAITTLKIQGHKLHLILSGKSLMLWVKVSENDTNIPSIPLADTLELTFLLKSTNNTFFQITQLGMLNAGQLFFFSNKRLATEDPGFPLIKKDNNTSEVSESFLLNPSSTANELEQLSAVEKKNLAGILRLCIKGENGGYHLLKSNGNLRDESRTFNIVFPNRKTTWRYFFESDQVVTGADNVKKEQGNARQLITRTEKPLTAKGFVSVKLDGKELPNPDTLQMKPDETLTKIYTEIYM